MFLTLHLNQISYAHKRDQISNIWRSVGKKEGREKEAISEFFGTLDVQMRSLAMDQKGW
jgi:hypothetical protein